ncbi:MAG: hypothetical protein JWM02_1949 [Frankiales bacterium]|nr:hypothetical protein [Frankiales bacterium]
MLLTRGLTPPRVVPAAARLAVLIAAAAVLAAVHPRGRPATLCLLRATTGVPCPLCGSTTAFVRLGHGHLRAALTASPLAVLGTATFALSPLAPATVVQAVRRVRYPLLLTALSAGELWQLHRFL